MAELRHNRLEILPLPEGGALTPETAREWLAELAPEWLTVLTHGPAEIEDRRTRDAYATLGGDLRTMLEAAVHAMTTGRPVALERDDFAGRAEAALPALARLVASKDVAFRESVGPFEECFQQLAEELARRLGERFDDAEAAA